MNASAKQEEIKKYSLKADSVLFTKDSESFDDIAIPAYVLDEIPGVICGYHLGMITPKQNIFGKYIHYLFQSKVFNYQYVIATHGMTRFGLGKNEVQNSLIVVIPMSEQIEIVDYLDHSLKNIEVLEEKYKQQVDLLRKYKESLISEVVTGKIDVRDYDGK